MHKRPTNKKRIPAFGGIVSKILTRYGMIPHTTCVPRVTNMRIQFPMVRRTTKLRREKRKKEGKKGLSMHVWFLKQAIELENPKVSRRERDRERVESLTKTPRLTPSQAAQHTLLTLLPGNILPNPNLRFLSSLLNPLRKAFDSSFQSIYLLQLMNSCLSPFNFNDLF